MGLVLGLGCLAQLGMTLGVMSWTEPDYIQRPAIVVVVRLALRIAAYFTRLPRQLATIDVIANNLTRPDSLGIFLPSDRVLLFVSELKLTGGLFVSGPSKGSQPLKRRQTLCLS